MVLYQVTCGEAAVVLVLVAVPVMVIFTAFWSPAKWLGKLQKHFVLACFLF